MELLETCPVKSKFQQNAAAISSSSDSEELDESNHPVSTRGAPVSKESPSYEYYTIVSTLSFILIFLFIGIPIWWKTTEIYRASMPFHDIDQLYSSKMKHLIHITLLVDDDSLDVEEVDAAIKKANEIRYENVNTPQLEFTYSWNVRLATKAMKDVIINSKSLSALDENFKPLGANLVSDLTIVLSNKFNSHPRHIIGAYRIIYVSSVESDVHLLAKDLVTTVVYNVVREDVLRAVHSPIQSEARIKPTKERMRPLQASPAVDIVLSTFVTQPADYDIHLDVEGAYKNYMKPVISKLKDVMHIDFKSQFKFGLSVDLPTEFHKESGEYRIQSSKLNHLINQIEKHLPSQVSLNNILNFVVYVVPKEKSPLFIYDDEGKKLESNAFISPRWGGVMFYNIDHTQSSSASPSRLTLDARKIFQVILTQLRPLIGITERNTRFNTHYRVDNNVIADWEVDFLMRRRSHDYISSAVSSLYALSNLLQTISNIVINDNIAQLSQTSVESSQQALRSLQQGHLKTAFSSSQDASITADQAFFDPTLLELLYFPDDQKYAIYVPLFVPTIVPIVFSVRAVVRHVFALHRKSKLKTE